jgi:hypothetical protein
VGHHAKHIPVLVEYSRDVSHGTIGVIGVAERDAVVGFELVERAFVGDELTFAVRYGQREGLPLVHSCGEGRIRGLSSQADITADELQSGVADERTWQQARFHKDLESVADAENKTPVGGELLHRLHYGRKTSNGAATEVIAIREPARQDDGVHLADGVRVVPNELGGGGMAWPIQVLINGVPRIVVAIAAWEDNDADFHWGELQFNRLVICWQSGGYDLPAD